MKKLFITLTAALLATTTTFATPLESKEKTTEKTTSVVEKESG